MNFARNKLIERNKLHQNIQAAALALILFTFPFRPLMLNNICIVLLGVNWLFYGSIKVKLDRLLQSKIALLYIGLFCMLIISYFLSGDKAYAGFVLEKNLMILLLPLVLSTSTVTRVQVNKAFYAFVAGCSLGIVICLLMALKNYRATQETHYFFYHDLSNGIELHAVYFSLYIAVCILFLTLELNAKWRHLSLNQRLFYVSAIVSFCCFIVLLSSKTIIVGLLLMVNLFFFTQMSKQKKFIFIILIVVVNISLLVAVLKINYVKSRFIDSLNSNIEFIKKDTYSELTVFTGVTVRITFWKFILEILNANNAWWSGMTIGNAHNALHNKAVEKNLYGGNLERGWTDYTNYNAHNQYFQYLLMMGLPGLIYFLIILISTLYYSLTHKDQLLLLCTLLFILFCFTESVLEVNKGIVFFSFIPSLLIYSEALEDRISMIRQ